MSKKIPAPKTTVKGTDVSRWQNPIDWKKAKAAGYEFVIAKASDGATYKDKMFANHIKAAKAAGMITGAYHWLQFNADPLVQARNFADAIKAVGGVDLIALDVEWSNGLKTVGKVGSETAMKCLKEIERLLGRKPLVYTSAAFFIGYTNGSEWGKYPLWIASYRTDLAVIPDCWNAFTFWQQTDKEKVPGGPVKGLDGNRFNGDMVALQAFVSGGHAVPPKKEKEVDNSDWMALQLALNEHGANIKADGIPGPKTKAALIQVANAI